MKLRGHHLICLHFFKGEGYTSEFVKNLEVILSKVETREVRIVMGPDDLCKACPNLSGERCTKGEKKITELELLALNLLKGNPGDTIEWEDIKERLPEILDRWKKRACLDCEYEEVCKSVNIERDE